MSHIEYILQFILPIAIGGIIWAIAIYSNVYDTEVWTDTTVKIIHQEFYETEETRYYSCNCDSNGQNCQTCSEDYCSSHSEYWEAISSSGWSEYITEDRYRFILRKWGVQDSRIGARGDIGCRRGDTYAAEWPGDLGTREIIAKNHKYQNKVRYDLAYVPQRWSKSMESIKLLPEPSAKNGTVDLVVGFWLYELDRRVANEILQNHAAEYGPQKQEDHGQVIPIIYIYHDATKLETIQAHRAKYQGGNKNEYSVLLGVKNNVLMWYDIVTFTENGACVNRMKEELNRWKGEPIELVSVANWMTTVLGSHWERKSFTPLNAVMKFKPSAGWWIGGIITNLVLAISLGFMFILNDEKW